MRCRLCLMPIIVACVAAESSLPAAEAEISNDVIRAAVSRSIPQLEKGAAGSADNRMCFTCHNQAMPILALVEARRRGFAVDKKNLNRQVSHTAEHLKRGQKNYLQGRGQGGKAITAGYALWALESAGWEADETTAAVAGYLVDYQRDAGRWSHPGRRPPSSGSDFTTSYVALRALQTYGTAEQQATFDARKEVVAKWLLGETPSETEDRVFRLRAMKYLDAPPDSIRGAAAELIESQQRDGGWSQTPDMESDAYATATVLVALLRDGGLAADSAIVRRAVRHLLDTQLEDGTWHVVSRARPFQTYFETGFPHGKDQFISIAASSWATLALSLTLPEAP